MEFQTNFANMKDFTTCHHGEFKQKKQLVLENWTLLSEELWKSVNTQIQVDDTMLQKHVIKIHKDIQGIIDLPFGKLKTIVTEVVAQILFICADKGAVESFFQRRCVLCIIEG